MNNSNSFVGLSQGEEFSHSKTLGNFGIVNILNQV